MSGRSARQRTGGRAGGLREDRSAVSEVVGVVILIGITVVLALVYFLITDEFRGDTRDPVESGGRAAFWDDGYWVTPTGPDDIPVAGTSLHLTIDGVKTVIPLSTFSSTLGGQATWPVGTRICIVGSAPGCYTASAERVQLAVFTREEFVFALDNLLMGSPPFTVDTGGGGVVVTTTQPLRIDNVGSAITCGASGPVIPVTARLTQDGGATYTALWGGTPVNVDGGETLTLPAVPVAAVLGVRGTTIATGGCGSAQYSSTPADPHVLVLRAGDAAPNKPAFGSQPELLEDFLQPYVNTFTSTMVLDVNQVILLFEFTSDLSSSAADFQDLVILFTFGG